MLRLFWFSHFLIHKLVGVLGVNYLFWGILGNEGYVLGRVHRDHLFATDWRLFSAGKVDWRAFFCLCGLSLSKTCV